MVRQYKRKGKTPWRNKDKRMAAAVRKRGEGKSLREIAEELAVSYETIRRDLARSNVVPLIPRAVTSARHVLPPAGRDVTDECDSEQPKLRSVK